MTFIFLPHLSIIAYVNSATHYDIMLWLFSLKIMISMKENKVVFLSNSMSKKTVVKLELQRHHWFTTGRKGKTITIQGSNVKHV